MTNLLIMLTLPEKVRNKYYAHLKAKFPEIRIDMVDHHSKVGPYIGSSDVLITFGAHMSDDVLKQGTKLKWVQALGTGVDGIIGEPSLRDDVLVTNMHGLHGVSMPESASQVRIAWLTNSGPLSERRKRGAPCSETSRVGTSITRPERIDPATSIARHSRVNSSITVKHLICWPLAQASNTKS